MLGYNEHVAAYFPEKANGKKIQNVLLAKDFLLCSAVLHLCAQWTRIYVPPRCYTTPLVINRAEWPVVGIPTFNESPEIAHYLAHLVEKVVYPKLRSQSVSAKSALATVLTQLPKHTHLVELAAAVFLLPPGHYHS